MHQDPEPGAFDRFVKRHKLALIAGAVVIVLIAMSDNEEASAPGVQPFGGAGQPVAAAPSSEPGFDMEGWRREQRRDDIEQRERVDTIREVERCYDPETGTTVEVSIHTGC